ncbi:hypothetical protein JYU34_001960 [Plutella xylostella]|uniref:C2H2-type domain-containing protein n=1 Tax=Plutella xylostella TaxID=51655 RepID=A0ABQ7R582_PLUXY|nr:hypothetical protein JYU34_001960 [Plutella xylostella]
MSINVFGLEYNNETKKNEIIGPLHFTKHRMPTHLNLLYLTNGSNGHYCLIKNMSRLLSKQITTSNEAIHICDGCLLHFSNKEHLNLHQKMIALIYELNYLVHETQNPTGLESTRVVIS